MFVGRPVTFLNDCICVNSSQWLNRFHSSSRLNWIISASSANSFTNKYIHICGQSKHIYIYIIYCIIYVYVYDGIFDVGLVRCNPILYIHSVYDQQNKNIPKPKSSYIRRLKAQMGKKPPKCIRLWWFSSNMMFDCRYDCRLKRIHK